MPARCSSTKRPATIFSTFRQIITEYATPPAVTRKRLYIDMMQTVLGNASKVLVDQKAGNNLLYLPLDKLIQQSGPVAVTPSAAPDLPSSRPSTAPTPDPAALDPSRARDALRSRDRPG